LTTKNLVDGDPVTYERGDDEDPSRRVSYGKDAPVMMLGEESARKTR